MKPHLTLKPILIAICVLMLNSINAQNLVNNGSFEQYTLLPDALNQLDRLVNWDNPGTTPGNIPSPDFLHNDGTGYGHPLAVGASNVVPADGDGVAGIILRAPDSKPNEREYIYSQLASPLEVGETYKCSMKVTMGTPGTFTGAATEAFQVYFSTSTPNQAGKWYINVTPHYHHDTVLTSPNWKTINFQFVATQAYEFITIGNFYSNSNCTTTDGSKTAYYFVDDVSLEKEITLPVEIISMRGKSEESYNEIQWRTGSEKNNDYFTVQKSVNGLDWEVLGRIEGAGNSTSVLTYSIVDNNPQQTSYYRLTQTDYDGKVSEHGSITIHRNKNTEIDLTFVPNPANEYVRILSHSEINQKLSVLIFNQQGSVVKKISIPEYFGPLDVVCDISDLQKGFYFFQIENTSGEVVEISKVVKH